MTRPLAITLGDAAGIGPETIAKAFRDAPELTRGCFVVGDAATLGRATQLIRREGEIVQPLVLLDSAEEALSVPPDRKSTRLNSSH